MKVIVEKIWNEPAVTVGLIATIALAAIRIPGGVTVGDVTTILMPLATSLGIRPLVTPAR